jgi:hypothetical protein
MPKLSCWCGESISLSGVPNDNGFAIVSETAIELLIGDLVSIHARARSEREFQADAYHRFVAGKSFPHVVECPRCGRLAVFRHESDDKPAMWFLRERFDDDDAATLRELSSQFVDPSE